MHRSTLEPGIQALIGVFLYKLGIRANTASILLTVFVIVTSAWRSAENLSFASRSKAATCLYGEQLDEIFNIPHDSALDKMSAFKNA